jgi:chromosome partitioning protein
MRLTGAGLMALVLTVAQQKGGAGKTTMAAHLAVAWAGRGRRVALVDIDPQGSLTAWAALRAELLGEENDLEAHAVEGWKARSLVDRLARERDVILIDSPPRIETDARSAIRAATLAIVPVQPSPLDLWATRPTIEIAERERTPVLLVANRVPARGRLVEEVLAKMREEKLPVARTTLGNRQAFAASLMEGQGVTEWDPSGLAADEARALMAEIERKAR